MVGGRRANGRSGSTKIGGARGHENKEQKEEEGEEEEEEEELQG